MPFNCITSTGMRTLFRTIFTLLVLLCAVGCFQKLYYRNFWMEEMPALEKRRGDGCFLFGEFAAYPFCDVSSLSYSPIEDSTFDVFLKVLPTDTSDQGNRRFVEGFGVDSVVIVETVNGDTVGILADCPDTAQNWQSQNRKMFVCGDVIIPKRIERITLQFKVRYLGPMYERREQWLSFRMYRHDGSETAIHGRWLH